MKRSKNVWVCNGGATVSQRKNRYADGWVSHPSKNYPCVTKRIIETISQPGETILDPMCGIGTTLVEAMDLGRNTFGVDIEPAFAKIARTNVQLAQKRGAGVAGSVVQGDARDLSKILKEKVDHVVMSPPFGFELVTKHQKGLKSSRPKGKKYLKGFETQGNVAFSSTGRSPPDSGYSESMLRIYQECFGALRENGKLAIILRNGYRKGDEVDLIGETIQICKKAGFQLKGRIVHVLSGISLWRIKQLEWDRSRIPDYTETVLVFQKPGVSTGGTK